MDYYSIMNLWFYDLQNILESYSKIIEERNNEEQKHAKENGYDPKQANPKTMMESAKNMMPKIPNFSFPKL